MTQTPQMYPIAQNAQFPNPQVNAVKIDIINPQAYGANGQATGQSAAQPQNNGYYYNYPTAPMYSMPVNPYYSNQQAPVTPNAQQNPVVPPVPMVPQVQQQAPAIETVANQPIQQIPQAIVDQPQQATPQAQAAVPEAQPAQQPLPAAAPVQQQNVPEAVLDIAAINNALSSADIDAQTAAIQKIAELGQGSPVQAKPLLNEQTFQSLVDIIKKDTSALPGPQEGQQSLSPLEKAEINKQFGTYTLAVLGKLFREEFDSKTAGQGAPTITINEIPGVKQMVDNLKDNPNPTIREASMSGLNYIAKAEDKEILKTLYDITAKQDADPNVKAAAEEHLKKLAA